jgi:hypothetical protein
MIMRQDVFNPFTWAPRHHRTPSTTPRRFPDTVLPVGIDEEWEIFAMTALDTLKRDVPPPSPERMAAGKARLLALAAERRRERLIDLAG